jgi:hypothetical protein
MGGRVREFPRAVARGRQDAAVPSHDYRAHGHLAAGGGGAGLGQSRVHVAREGHGAVMHRRAAPLKRLSRAARAG